MGGFKNLCYNQTNKPFPGTVILRKGALTALIVSIYTYYVYLPPGQPDPGQLRPVHQARHPQLRLSQPVSQLRGLCQEKLRENKEGAVCRVQFCPDV